jgi:exodeoxyribonuclease VII large subunit
MAQLPMFKPLSWSVTELTGYLRELLEGDDLLQDLWVRGEVSNVNRPGSGHLYFTIKDAGASLRCVMWRNAALRQIFLPRDGEAVEVHGYISLYEVSGTYQLYADLIRPAGEGLLYQEFLRLKARLDAEGLFDPERKRTIPLWPQTLGIVTSPSGAALRDMLNTLHRRYPLVRVILAPTPVQGVEAAGGIVRALQLLDQEIHPDVILLARGGGSIEDLWAFNDEQVARAIAASRCPVITGIGHETDYTIADFVADLRAPTPTAAAELATPNRVELLQTVWEQRESMARAMQVYLLDSRSRLEDAQNQLRLLSPAPRIRRDRQRLDDLLHRADRSLAHQLQLNRAHLTGLEQRLNTLSPLSVLQRGYAIVTRPGGTLVRSTSQVSAGDDLDVRVSDGSFGVRVQPAGKK